MKWLTTILLVMLCGCVSKGDFNTVTANNDKLTNKVADLEVKLNTLNQEKRAVDERLSILEQQNNTLRNTNQLLANKNSKLSEEVLSVKNRVLEVKKEADERERALAFASQTYEDLVASLKDEVRDGQVQIREAKNRLQVTLVDKIIFPAGAIEIDEKGRKLLKKVAKVLKGVSGKRIQVEGHSDKSPVAAAKIAQFPTNWEISARRATEVVRYLIEQGVKAKNLAAVGLSHFHPIASNKTAKGRQANRRIEIILLPKPQVK